MVRTENSIREKWKEFKKTPWEIWRFLDGPDFAFIVVALAVFAYVFDAGHWSPTTMAVAIFTAIYAFIASNQMRQDVQTHTANVRRDYGFNPESELQRFGLRNFGPGPALYIRVFATVVEGTGEDGGKVVESKVISGEDDPPMSLKEGEFLPVMDDDFPTLSTENDARRLNLYYSYVSRNGAETPENQHNPREKTHEELANDTSNPRSIKLEKLRKHCMD